MKKIITFVFIIFVLGALNIASADKQYAEISSLGSLFPLLINKDTTIEVPSKVGRHRWCHTKNINTIQDALLFLKDKKIATDVIVTIKVTKDPSEEYKTINVVHPDGDRIHIIGDCKRQLCTIGFEDDASGLVVDNGNKLGLLDGFIFIGKNLGGDAVGITANQKSSIILGSNISVQNFYIGIYAVSGSFIKASYVKASNNQCIGVIASAGSTIIADNAEANSNVSERCAHLCCDGIAATGSSYVNASYATANNNKYGIVSASGSTVVADNATANNNIGYGFGAGAVSTMRAEKAKANNNGSFGFWVNYNSFIYAWNATAFSNIKGDCLENTGGFILNSKFEGCTKEQPSDNEIRNVVGDSMLYLGSRGLVA